MTTRWAGYGTLGSTAYCVFFFKRVSGLSPRVDIAPHGFRDLAQLHWANSMYRLGGGRVDNPYPTNFFPWSWR